MSDQLNPQNFNGWAKVLEDAYTRYERSGDEFLPAAAELSANYLEFLILHPDEKFYNYGFRLDELNEKKLMVTYHTPYSVCSLHFLFRTDRDKAIKMLEQYMDNVTVHPFQLFPLLYHHLQKDALPFFKKAFTPEIPGVWEFTVLLRTVTNYFKLTDFTEELWKLALIDIKSKPIRDLIAQTLSNASPDINRAIELLDSKKSTLRQTAAIILSQNSAPEAITAIRQAIDRETNDESRNLLLASIADSLPNTMTREEVEEMIAGAKKRGRLNKPLEPSLDESLLPPLHFTTGEKLTPEHIRFLLYRMNKADLNQLDPEAKYLLQHIDKNTAGPFASKLLGIALQNGGAAERKYLIAAAALLGGEDIVDSIHFSIERWADANRNKMAEYGISALVQQGSDKALRRVEAYTRKYKSKKAAVGAAAQAALETTAQQLGITFHELGDRIIPDFGFDGLFKSFTVGQDEYRAFIDSHFKLTYFDEDNKKLKTLPAATSEVQKLEFKAIAKEVREIVKSQSSRLEYYLIIQRKWTSQQWQSFFLANPVMFIYATKLLWGVYPDNTETPPIQTFRCDEDTTLFDLQDEEYTPPSESYIGIAHPLHLDTATLRAWQEKFFDLGIEPIFPQVERKLVDFSDIDLNATIIRKFEGRQTKEGSIRSTLEKHGWQKGPTGDGGLIENFLLKHLGMKLEIVLEVEGVGAGFGWGLDEKLGSLYVRKAGQVIPLTVLPILFLQEAISTIESIKLPAS